MCPPPRFHPELVLLAVADRHREGDPVQTYLAKLRRTMTDMLAGRPVRRWRLDRLMAYCEDLSRTCLQRSDRGGCF
jgi:hypothetical protein